jgi:tetratricopeptide (TPR) repeat protein
MQDRHHTPALVLITAVTTLFISSLAAAQAQTLAPEISELRAAWDQANFSLTGGARKKAMHELVATCDELLPQHAQEQAALTWCGIVNSSYAGLAGALSAMKYAKAARSQLEQALEIDQGDMAGPAHTSLGTLYYKVPGWPIGFGDGDKARQELEAGIAASPDDIDANFFFADFLREQGELAAAQTYLERAAAAPARSGREVADAGRQREIETMRADIAHQLSKR